MLPFYLAISGGVATIWSWIRQPARVLCHGKGRVNGEGAACMFLASKETYTGPCYLSVWDGTRNPPKCWYWWRPSCHRPEGKTNVNWRDKHVSYIQVWNSRAQLLYHGAWLECDMSPTHPYFHWYCRVTWKFVNHTTVALLIMVIASTFLFKFWCISPCLC